MITRAKANLSAIKTFDLSVSAVKDFSPKFDRGINCLEELFKQLSEFANTLRDNVEKMASAQETLAVKIKNIEEILAKLTARLNQLEEKLSNLEDRLTGIPSTITITDSEGESHEVSNPAYDAMEARISAVEMEIDAVRAEMYPHQVRLDRANSVNGQLASHMDAVNGVIYSLEEKKSSCKQLRTELEDIQRQNLFQGAAATDALKKIEGIISNYLNIKMVYENTMPFDREAAGAQNGININININKTTNTHEQTIVQQPEMRPIELSAEEVKAHKVRFDDEGRIAQYDEKSFGGEYNSYDTRLSRTSADDNPIFGRYEGIRGESKYIPSRRTVEGVIVTEILSQYGIDGISYRNAEPDFEPCAEAVVKIAGMTENRENYSDSTGEIALGNFSQADIELAKAWNLGNREGRSNWEARDVLNYRKANKLTWHEKCDTETMVLVRMEINLFFKHSGGCSECRVRDGIGTDGGDFDE